MRACIITERQAAVEDLLAALAKSDCHCTASDVFTHDALHTRRPDCGGHDLCLVVIGESVRASLRMLGELRAASEASLLVIGPADDPKLILEAVRAGADDYFDERGALDAQLRSFISRLHKGPRPTEANGHLIGIVSPVGGVGRSTIAVNLAAALARLHSRCALVDLDLLHADASVLLNLAPRHTIADLCRNVDRLDGEMLRQSLAKHDSGVCLVAAPAEYGEAPLVTVEGAMRVFALARSEFPAVVVDAPASFDSPLLGFTKQCDHVILVTRLDFASVRNSRRAIAHFQRMGVDEEKIKVLVNRVGQPQELPLAKAQQALGVAHVFQTPNDPATANLCANCGAPAVCKDSKSRLARSVIALAQGLYPPAVERDRQVARTGWLGKLPSISQFKAPPVTAPAVGRLSW